MVQLSPHRVLLTLALALCLAAPLVSPATATTFQSSSPVVYPRVRLPLVMHRLPAPVVWRHSYFPMLPKNAP